MAFEQKDMSGALFVNDKKAQQKQGAPDYRGDATIAGYKFKISGWEKTGKESGKTFLSLSFESVQDQVPPPSPIQGQVVAAAVKHAPARPAPAPAQEQDETIPF
jgi:uncharacterized protein (DUF736 family)